MSEESDGERAKERKIVREREIDSDREKKVATIFAWK